MDAPKISNIEHLLSGYDVFFGNLMATGERQDPGFRDPIFNTKYYGNMGCRVSIGGIRN